MNIAQWNSEAKAQKEMLDIAPFADKIQSYKVEFGELTITVLAKDLLSLVEDLQINRMYGYTILVDVTAIDFPQRENRFSVVYHLLSITHNQRMRIHVELAENEIIPSLTGIHPSANWFEREVFDMFGIPFSGHPDLRRILTDYGFEGFPLRKDFPMTGYVQMRYDELEKRCIYEPVQLVQDYRDFEYGSSWEGVLAQIPQDEKSE